MTGLWISFRDMSLDPKDSEDVELVRAALQAKAQVKSKRGWGHAVALLVVSLLLFWTQQQSIAGQTGSWIAALVIVLVVHEGGHWLAMRAFGYTDLKVFFIPFFGAAASGIKQDASATQRAVVSLAGPLPGISFALVAAWFAPFESELFKYVVVLALFINAFNLLPFVPLDGVSRPAHTCWDGARQPVDLLEVERVVGARSLRERAHQVLGSGRAGAAFAGDDLRADGGVPGGDRSGRRGAGAVRHYLSPRYTKV